MNFESLPLLAFFAFLVLILSIVTGGMIYASHQDSRVRLKAIEALERLSARQTTGDGE